MRWTNAPALQATQAVLCASHSVVQHAKQACVTALLSTSYACSYAAMHAAAQASPCPPKEQPDPGSALLLQLIFVMQDLLEGLLRSM